MNLSPRELRFTIEAIEVLIESYEGKIPTVDKAEVLNLRSDITYLTQFLSELEGRLGRSIRELST